MEEFEKQGLTEHLADLRKSLINSLIATGLGFAVCYYYAKEISVWFVEPLYAALPEQSSLIFTSFQEAFFFI